MQDERKNPEVSDDILNEFEIPAAPEPGELPEEDDDNPYQESDEALPDDVEEEALSRNPSREGGLFDEV